MAVPDDSPNVEKMLHSSRERMSISTEHALNSVFSKFATKRKQSLAVRKESLIMLPEGALLEGSVLHIGAATKMSKEQLRSDQVFSDINNELFDFLFRLFDPSETGQVNTDQFVMAVGLIAAASESDNLELQIETCFYMFDTDRTGRLSRDEFEAMVKTTIGLKLEYLLQTSEGSKAFEGALQKEFAHENFAFWQEARKYAQAAEEARRELAEGLLEQYINSGAAQQVNLPSRITNAIHERLASSKPGPPPADLLDAAAQEIFVLMERDTHERFKEDQQQAHALVDDFFDNARGSSNATGEVSFEQYREWVLRNPHVLVFFHEVGAKLKKLVERGKERLANGSPSLHEVRA